MKRMISGFASFKNLCTIFFTVSLAFGSFNPFVGKTAGEGTLSLTQILTVFIIPMLLFSYKGSINKLLVFNNWVKPLLVFFILSFVISLVLASSVTIGLFMEWLKLLMGILICIFIPIVFRNKTLMHMSLLFYSITCSLICFLVVAGLLNNYNEMHNGRLWLWGENPNSTSTRWVLAIIFIINNTISNPLGMSKLRIILLPLIVPLILLVMMSGSVGSFLITLIAIFLSLLTEMRKNFIFVSVLVGGSIIVASIIIFSNFDTDTFSIIDRFLNKIHSNEEDERVLLMRASWNVFLANPLFGSGSFDYLNEMYKQGVYNVVHNMYMYVLSISGIIGFVPFVIFNIKILRGCLHILKVNSLALVLFVYMFFIANKTGGVLTYLFMWFVFGLVVTLINNVKISNIECHRNFFMKTKKIPDAR